MNVHSILLSLCALLVVIVSSTIINTTSAQCDEGSEWFGSDCWCSVGYYSSDGRAPCNPCENSFNTVVGASRCTCNPGYASPTGSTPSCTKCDDLSDTLRAPHVGQTPYDFARAMYDMSNPNMVFPSNPGESSCVCVKGSFGVDGKPPCSQCPPNSSSYYLLWVFENWYTVPAMESCLCSPGFWNVNGGHPQVSDPCVPCSQYSYSKNPGSTSCLHCVANAYRETAEAPCQPCPVGTTATAPSTAIGLASCAMCDVGYYSPSGNSPCVPCEDGFTTTSIGQNTCWPWDAVHTGEPTRAPTAAPTGPSAKPSPSPTATPTIRKTSRPSAKPTMQPTNADDCPPGFHSNTGKGPHCKRCPKGTTNDDYGQRRCPLCKDGYYSTDGTTPCLRCPNGWSTTAEWGHRNCVPCFGYAPGCAKSHIYYRLPPLNSTTAYLRGYTEEE